MDTYRTMPKQHSKSLQGQREKGELYTKFTHAHQCKYHKAAISKLNLPMFKRVKHYHQVRFTPGMPCRFNIKKSINYSFS